LREKLNEMFFPSITGKTTAMGAVSALVVTLAAIVAAMAFTIIAAVIVACVVPAVIITMVVATVVTVVVAMVITVVVTTVIIIVIIVVIITVVIVIITVVTVVIVVADVVIVEEVLVFGFDLDTRPRGIFLLGGFELLLEDLPCRGIVDHFQLRAIANGLDLDLGGPLLDLHVGDALPLKIGDDLIGGGLREGRRACKGNRGGG